MASPRIVVGMGCYNEEDYLEQTIPPVLAQTMPDFHLLILDNGSTDNSADILQQFAASDSRITFLRSPTNLIPADAANHSWSLAMDTWPECRWFMGQGADDIMAPDYLEAVLRVADADPSVNCIFSPVTFIGHPRKGVWTYPRYDAKRAHQQLMVPGWRAFTRELWEAVGPENNTCGIGADWEWIVRASVAGVLKPHQLERSYNAIRIRENGRVTQSDTGDRAALRRHLATLTT